MQILELARDVHPYFIAGQFHPELTSRPLRPSPMFTGLVVAALQAQSRHPSCQRIKDPADAR